MQDLDYAVTTTAACDMGNCRACRGVVFSLTDAHLTDCGHGCHTPAPIEDDELDDLLAEDADRRLDMIEFERWAS
jgi:hypothetical protein